MLIVYTLCCGVPLVDFRRDVCSTESCYFLFIGLKLFEVKKLLVLVLSLLIYANIYYFALNDLA